MTTTRRVRLHARIGEALEKLYGEHVEEQAAELAHHFAEAEPLAGPLFDEAVTAQLIEEVPQ